MCMVSCPFGAISDKSQIFQLAHALKEGKQIVAEVAPAFVSQFGPEVTSGKLRDALTDLGFADVFEVALGADIGGRFGSAPLRGEGKHRGDPLPSYLLLSPPGL